MDNQIFWERLKQGQYGFLNNSKSSNCYKETDKGMYTTANVKLTIWSVNFLKAWRPEIIGIVIGRKFQLETC